MILSAITLFASVKKYSLKFKTSNKIFIKYFSISTIPILITFGYFLATGILKFGPRTVTMNAFSDRFTQWSYAFLDPKWFKGIGLTAKFVIDDIGDTTYTSLLDPHNLYLSTSLNLGMLSGLMMLLSAILTLIFVTRKLSSINNDYCFYLLIFAIILISPIGGSMFSINNIYDRTAWIALSFIFLEDKSRKLTKKINE